MIAVCIPHKNSFLLSRVLPDRYKTESSRESFTKMPVSAPSSDRYISSYHTPLRRKILCLMNRCGTFSLHWLCFLTSAEVWSCFTTYQGTDETSKVQNLVLGCEDWGSWDEQALECLQRFWKKCLKQNAKFTMCHQLLIGIFLEFYRKQYFLNSLNWNQKHSFIGKFLPSVFSRYFFLNLNFCGQQRRRSNDHTILLSRKNASEVNVKCFIIQWNRTLFARCCNHVIAHAKKKFRKL